MRFGRREGNLVKNAIWQKGRDQQGEPQNKQGRRPPTYIGGAAWEAGKGEQQPFAIVNTRSGDLTSLPDLLNVARLCNCLFNAVRPAVHCPKDHRRLI